MKSVKAVDLTSGKISTALIKLAIPIMMSSLLQFIYGLIDMLWVGRLGSYAITVIGSSSFFVGLGYAINSIVVIGTGIKVSHAIGRKEQEVTKEYINNGLVLNVIIGIGYMMILIFFGRNFIDFLGLGNLKIIRDSYLYLVICAPMLLLAFFNTVYIRLLNSFGNNVGSLKISATGIIINIVLDPILIYFFKFGVLGAAVATLISNLIMFILFNIRYWNTLKFNRKYGVSLEKSKEILRLGFPMAMQRIIFTLVNIIIAKIVAVFGDNAIAAQKIGLQIESVTYMVIGGLNGAVASFIGQNFGAKKYERINKGYFTSLKIGGVYSGAMTIVFILFAIPLAKLFVSNGETITMASNYLRILAISQIFSMIEVVSNGTFTGIAKPKIPSVISIVFTTMRIPLALILMKIFGLNGIWLSFSLSSILKGCTAFIIYKFKCAKDIMKLEV
ncbi:MAG: MATE family efflux transporter [Clostridium sp.]